MRCSGADIGVVSDQPLLPGYRGSEDRDTRDDGGKGLLSQEELEVQAEVFSERCLGKKEQGKKKEDEGKTEETKKEKERREQGQTRTGRLPER